MHSCVGVDITLGVTMSFFSCVVVSGPVAARWWWLGLLGCAVATLGGNPHVSIDLSQAC